MARPRREWRTRFLVLLIGGPAVCAALTLSVIETWRWLKPDSPLFSGPAPGSFADAIAQDDVTGAYAFIRAGQDPNGVIAAHHPVLTGGRRVDVPPLLWAVATGSEGTVAMLLGLGGRLDALTRSQAVCLAEHIGRDDIVRLLALGESRRRRDEPCPPTNIFEKAPNVQR